MSNSQRPAFSAPLYAALRQGTKELSQVLQAFPDSIRPVEESGMMGNPTPQMITEEIRPYSSYDQLLDRYSSRGDSDRGQERGLER